MIRLFRKDKSSFDAEDLFVGVPVPDSQDEDGKGEIAFFPWAHVAKFTLFDGAIAINDTTLNGMPVRVLVWQDTSGTKFEIPMPVDAAEDIGRALAGIKLQVATELPKEIVTPSGFDPAA
jgi:hypothetical protein